MRKIIGVGFIILGLQSWVFAQTPTVQDCLGAIPICQNQYSESTIHYGDGNYNSEINDNISCLDQEYYSVWYTFTAQTSGYFRFSITPNTYSNDYDWAVFNLTNANCSEIYTNPSLCVSCNSYGDYDGNNGSTGANSSLGYGSSNGPGTENGPAWNSDIPVAAGNTYVMLICNWSQSTSGYSLNFDGSTAVIYDNVPPHILPINSPLCGDSSVIFQFSENVICSSVNLSDFQLVGPGGTIPVASVFGAACASGGTQERYFKLRTNHSLQKGTYKLILSGPVNDLCGNTSVPDTLQFIVSGIHFQTSATPSICNPNGTATCAIINGQSPYTYHWSNGQTVSPATGLLPGTYSVTISDTHGCVDSSSVVVPGGSGTAQVTLEKHDLDCYEDLSGWIKVHPTVGTPPFTFVWSNGTTDSIASHLSAGSYTVTVYDHYGCSTRDSVALTQNPPFTAAIDSVRNETCFYADGAIYVHAEGGVPQYHYLWSESSASDLPFLENRHAGSYTVTVKDSANCAQVLTADIQGQPYPTADFMALPMISFLAQANIRFVNQSQNSTTYSWAFADGTLSDEESPWHRYTELGHFPVMLVVSSNKQCVDTVIKYVDIVEDFSIYIPNAFTPDNDGQNEWFGPVILGAKDTGYRFEIFSRWGEPIFKTEKIDQYWDGSYLNQQRCPNGVYTYMIEAVDLCNIRHKYIGQISIVK
jgi:gliding motility-associated-like protein